jgi:hypothetical protein
MRSQRRFAQIGLASAGLLFVTTVAILYQGSKARPESDANRPVSAVHEIGTIGDPALGYAAFAK